MRHTNRHNAVLESKRIRLDPRLAEDVEFLCDRMWGMRRRRIDTLTHVGALTFKTLDGTDAFMRVYIDPSVRKQWGLTGTEPEVSRDPMDLVLSMCHPREFTTKRDLHNVLVHEVLHAVDPTETTRYNVKDQAAYRYWEGPESRAYLTNRGEYSTIHSEFLDAVVRLFRDMERTHSTRTRMALLDDLLAFFAAGGPGRAEPSPALARMFARMSRDRDLLEILDGIRGYSPRAHKLFLGKLHSTVEEIREGILNQRGRRP